MNNPLTEVAGQAAALEALRAAAAALLLRRLAGKLEDIHAHARLAVADAAGRTPAALGPAGTRLDALADWLGGPHGALRDFRDSAYRLAWSLQAQTLAPSGLRAPWAGADAPAEFVADFRNALTFGRDLGADVTAAVQRVSEDLAATVRLSSLSSHMAPAAHRRWHAHALASLSQLVATSLVNAVEAAQREAGTDQIDPRYLDTTELLVDDTL